MAYTVGQIKVLAYNMDEKGDFNVPEFQLFLGLAYCYEWFRANPDDREACQELMDRYIDFFEHSGWLVNSKPIERPSWLERAKAEKSERDQKESQKQSQKQSQK